MPDKKVLPKHGWDADVLLSYVDQIAERMPDLDELLHKARTNQIEIVTSAISTVEVAYGAAERNKGALDPEVEAQIDELWAQGSPIKVVELHPVIGRIARSLVRDAMVKGWRLSPRDAIHLATAKNEGAIEFNTYEARLVKYNELLGFHVGPPQAEQPSILGGQTERGANTQDQSAEAD